MLYYETITSETLELLKAVQQRPELEALRLVGGTGFALQTGHRRSIDLDFFGELQPDEYELINILNNIGKTEPISLSKNIKIFQVNGIKVDFVNYPFPWLKPPISEDLLRLAAIEDIAAMKLEAVTGRGTRKDFIDVFFLLNYFTLTEIIEFYKAKFNTESEFMMLRSLVYFEDAEKDEFPQMLKEVSWNNIKYLIKNAVKNYKLL